MVCKLPVPYWTSQQSGLLSVTENVLDGYIVLDIAPALPVYPGVFSYYNLYWSTNLNTLYDKPQGITSSRQVSIPNDLASLSHYFSVRAAQMGVSGDISSSNLSTLHQQVSTFPQGDSTLQQDLVPSSTHIVIEDASDLPLTDGYIQVEDEIILYSEIVDGYAGFDGLLISNRDPFGCNLIGSHLSNTDVSLFKGFEDLNVKSFKPTASCGMPEPTWESPSNRGISKVDDLGIGTSVKVEWFDAKAPIGFSRIYFNIYQSSTLYGLFGSLPVGVSTSNSAIVPNLTPGKSYYFGVRATYHTSDLDLPNLTQLSENFYAYPTAVNIAESDGYFFSNQIGEMKVDETTGFPLFGSIGIASEILAYNSLLSDSFNISDRDVFGLNLVSDYPNGTSINFFKGIEDKNFQFYRSIPSWDGSTGVPNLPVPDGYLDGYVDLNYNQDSDGYRSVFDDIVTEDLSAFEEDNDDFDPFNYCGYRKQNPVALHQGGQCGTYHGHSGFGTVPGSDGESVPLAGGMNIWESAQQRSEVILGLTAEPFVLVRRKTTGRKCPRLSIRSEHPHARCGTCFGTNFLGGFDRFSNQRSLVPTQTNGNGFINIRVSPYDNDLELTSDRGLAQSDILDGWTIAVPIIKDRDILIRYIFDESMGIYVEDFRYEVLKVTRNKLFFGKSGQQKISMKKMDKTEEIYKFPISLI